MYFCTVAYPQALNKAKVRSSRFAVCTPYPRSVSHAWCTWCSPTADCMPLCINGRPDGLQALCHVSWLWVLQNREDGRAVMHAVPDVPTWAGKRHAWWLGWWWESRVLETVLGLVPYSYCNKMLCLMNILDCFATVTAIINSLQFPWRNTPFWGPKYSPADGKVHRRTPSISSSSQAGDSDTNETFSLWTSHQVDWALPRACVWSMDCVPYVEVMTVTLQAKARVSGRCVYQPACARFAVLLRNQLHIPVMLRVRVQWTVPLASACLSTGNSNRWWMSERAQEMESENEHDDDSHARCTPDGAGLTLKGSCRVYS